MTLIPQKTAGSQHPTGPGSIPAGRERKYGFFKRKNFFFLKTFHSPMPACPYRFLFSMSGAFYKPYLEKTFFKIPFPEANLRLLIEPQTICYLSRVLAHQCQNTEHPRSSTSPSLRSTELSIATTSHPFLGLWLTGGRVLAGIPW